MQQQFIEWALKHAEDSLAQWRGACFLQGFRNLQGWITMKFPTPPPLPGYECPVVQIEIRNGWIEHTCNGVVIERHKCGVLT